MPGSLVARPWCPAISCGAGILPMRNLSARQGRKSPAPSCFRARKTLPPRGRSVRKGFAGCAARSSVLFFFLILFFSLRDAAAQKAAQNVLMPTGRVPIVLQSGVRNPFGQVATAQEPTAIEATETEESRLRRIISFLKVGGVSGSRDNRRVLLGSLILRPGDSLPPLIENQQEVLRVQSINGNSVVLSFVDKETGAEPRLFGIPIRIQTPRVTQMLYGEAVENLGNFGKPARANVLQLKGVQDFIAGSKAVELLNVTDRKFDLMGGVKDAEKSKQGN